MAPFLWSINSKNKSRVKRSCIHITYCQKKSFDIKVLKWYMIERQTRVAFSSWWGEEKSVGRGIFEQVSHAFQCSRSSFGNGFIYSLQAIRHYVPSIIIKFFSYHVASHYLRQARPSAVTPSLPRRLTCTSGRFKISETISPWPDDKMAVIWAVHMS